MGLIILECGFKKKFFVFKVKIIEIKMRRIKLNWFLIGLLELINFLLIILLFDVLLFLLVGLFEVNVYFVL